MLCAPLVRLEVESDATPFSLRAELPRVALPSVKTTVPSGAMPPPFGVVTIAVKVTLWPFCDGVALEVRWVGALVDKLNYTSRRAASVGCVPDIERGNAVTADCQRRGGEGGDAGGIKSCRSQACLAIVE